jgi:hypothetical protein
MNADITEARILVDEERRDVLEAAERERMISEESFLREKRTSEEASMQVAEAMADASRATEGLHRLVDLRICVLHKSESLCMPVCCTGQKVCANVR